MQQGVHAQGFMNLGVAGSGQWYGNGKGLIDEVRFFDWALSDGEAYAEYVYSSNRYRCQPTGKPVSTGPIQVIDRRLIVDGNAFTVKGVGYQPVPIGAEPTGRPWIGSSLTPGSSNVTCGTCSSST